MGAGEGGGDGGREVLLEGMRVGREVLLEGMRANNGGWGRWRGGRF